MRSPETEQRHHSFVQDIYQRVRAAGDIYKGVYRGDYCVSCEKAYTKSELVGGRCPVHATETTTVEEESYFFRLGKYREALRTHIREHPAFIHPAERRNEILSRLEDEVLDLSISRSTFKWGIPLPDDPDHVIYVWFDALSNYVSALRAPEDRYSRYWPADCHVIGKDIIWFHTVIWPAMLLSAGFPLPEQIYAHGFILDREGRKMSKQLGNVTDPKTVVAEYSVDVLRFYFLRAFSSGMDGNFSIEDLAERYKFELANDLGNLVLRIAKLICTRLGGQCRTPGLPRDLDAAPTIEEYFRFVDDREHHRAIEALWVYIRRTNAYLNDMKPWKVSDPAALEAILGCGLEALRVIAHLLHPAMPGTARSIGASLGFEIGPIGALANDAAPSEGRRYAVTLCAPLFPPREKAAAPPRAEAPAPAPEKDPFAGLEIRVGLIEEARDHPNADKLFALSIWLGGDDRRSVCAGLRKHLVASDLQGKKVLVLANLKPVQLRGVESRGMVLATDRKDGKVAPVDPGDAEVGDLVAVEGIAPEPRPVLTVDDFEKAPIEMRGGLVTYRGKPLGTRSGPVRCDAADGARVR